MSPGDAGASPRSCRGRAASRREEGPHVKQFCEQCLDAATAAGASYADVRVTDTHTQALSVRNGVVEGVSSGSSFGFGVRVVADGAWGFAASSEVTRDSAARVAQPGRRHRAGVRDGRRASHRPVTAGGAHRPLERARAPSTRSPSAPRTSSRCCSTPTRRCARRPGIALTTGSMSFLRERKTFASSEGSFIEQDWVESSAGIACYAIGDGDVVTRSYPNSHGGALLPGRLGDDRRARPRRQRAAHRRAGRAAAGRSAVPGEHNHADPRRQPARAAGARVGRAPHRARPRARRRGGLRGHLVGRPRRPRHAALRLRRS